MKKMNVENLTLKEYLNSEKSQFLPLDLRDALVKLSLHSKLKLIIDHSQLGIEYSSSLNPFFLDIAGRFKKLVQSFKNTSKFDELLARALGFKRGCKSYRVLDATAGFLGDSLLMRSMGMEVVGIERNPIVALQILHSLNNFSSDFGEKFQFYWMDAEHFVSLESESSFDAVLYDPMYSHPAEKTKPKKEMQILREFIAEDDDGAKTALRLKNFCKRLVIKRPLKAPPLIDHPQIVFKGKSTRYDVYLKN
jgi:hypothetical protein